MRFSDSSASWLSRLSKESGASTIIDSPRDTKLLCLQRFVRLFAYGTSYLILAHFLSGLDIADARIGLFMTLTLLGDVIISFVLTLVTDQVGRRNVLAAGAGLMAMSGVVFAVSSNYWILVLASVVGVISPSGNEIGPFRAVEESILAQLTDKSQWSDVFAWYMLFGTLGAALGTLTCGITVQALQSIETWTEIMAYRVVFASYAILGVVKLALTLMLSSGVELVREPAYQPLDAELDEGLLSEHEDSNDDSQTTHSPTFPRKTTRPTAQPIAVPTPTLVLTRLRSFLPPISPLSIEILTRLILLFSIDSFASGLASPSWMTYFFTTVHSLNAGSLGILFLTTNLLATLSNLAALPIARRIGPLKTMVFTHLPSALFLALTPLPHAGPGFPGTGAAMALLALRACTQTMDQAPRQAFIAAAVLPAERTAVLGVVNVAKTLAQAGGIGSSGVLAGKKMWVLALSGAGVMKACYDLALLAMFLGVRERDEG